MSKLSIADASDLPALEYLVNNAYRGENSKKGWSTEADLIEGIRVNEEMLTEMLSHPDAVILKSTADDGTLEGCVYLDVQGDRLYLGLLTVSPELQAKGLGKFLLQAGEDYGKQKNLKGVFMKVLTLRPELVAWYERKGYHKTGEAEIFDPPNDLIRPLQPLEMGILEKIF